MQASIELGLSDKPPSQKKKSLFSIEREPLEELKESSSDKKDPISFTHESSSVSSAEQIEASYNSKPPDISPFEEEKVPLPQKSVVAESTPKHSLIEERKKSENFEEEKNILDKSREGQKEASFTKLTPYVPKYVTHRYGEPMI